MIRVVDGATFRPARAWDSLPIGAFDGFIAKLHWTDQGFPWHVNDGAELMAVITGEIDMHWREPGGAERCQRLRPGDIWYAPDGAAHRAVPIGEARVLVVERPDADTLTA